MKHVQRIINALHLRGGWFVGIRVVMCLPFLIRLGIRWLTWSNGFVQINWYKVSANHDQYSANDGVYLTKTGAVVCVELIYNEIDE